METSRSDYEIDKQFVHKNVLHRDDAYFHVVETAFQNSHVSYFALLDFDVSQHRTPSYWRRVSPARRAEKKNAITDAVTATLAVTSSALEC